MAFRASLQNCVQRWFRSEDLNLKSSEYGFREREIMYPWGDYVKVSTKLMEVFKDAKYNDLEVGAFSYYTQSVILLLNLTKILTLPFFISNRKSGRHCSMSYVKHLDRNVLKNFSIFEKSRKKK